jgi:hypothetical protein
MRQRLAAEAGEEVLDRELGHAAADLDGGPAEVRGDDDLGHREQGMVAGEWLGLGDVQRRGGDPAVGQGRRRRSSGSGTTRPIGPTDPSAAQGAGRAGEVVRGPLGAAAAGVVRAAAGDGSAGVAASSAAFYLLFAAISPSTTCLELHARVPLL